MSSRLDAALVQRGICETRNRAQTSIAEGKVTVNGIVCMKASRQVSESDALVLTQPLPYVGRGGYKLSFALAEFRIALKGLRCLDIGASTGGFTDCMLQNGAAKVYAIDVGHGQLAWSLRNDERVICMEKTNFRYVTHTEVPEEIDFASCDVSFISLTKILKPAYDLLREGGEMVCLIKPQFETTKEKVGKKGVVRDAKVHKEVIESTVAYAAATGFGILGLDYSPIRGPEGNIEYLLYMRKAEGGLSKEERTDEETASADGTVEEQTSSGGGTLVAPDDATRARIDEVVAASHESLEKGNE